MLALSTQTCIMGLPPPKSRNRQIFYEGLENLVRQVVGRTTSVIEIVPSTHQPFCLCTFPNLSCPASSDSFSFLQKRNLKVSGHFFLIFPLPCLKSRKPAASDLTGNAAFPLLPPLFFLDTVPYVCWGWGCIPPPRCFCPEVSASGSLSLFISGIYSAQTNAKPRTGWVGQPLKMTETLHMAYQKVAPFCHGMHIHFSSATQGTLHPSLVFIILWCFMDCA